MKCKSCDEILSDREATRKYSNINEYIELCDRCLQQTDIAFIEKQYEDSIETTK